MKRMLLAMAVTAALAGGACGLSSGRRPAAAPGQIVTVVRKAPRTGMGVLDPDTRLDSIYSGLALYSDDLYYSDELAAQVEKVTPAGALTRVASPFDKFEGPPGTGLHDAHAIAIDAAGTLYISDEANYVVRAIFSSGERKTVVGSGEPGFDKPVDGPALDVDLTDITNLAVDPASDLYMANGTSIAKLEHGSDHVRTVADFDEPVYGMTYDAHTNKIYAVHGHQISRIEDDGPDDPIAGTGQAGKAVDGANALQSKFGDLDGLAVNADGDLFVADRSNNVIDEITPDRVVRRAAGTGTKGFAGDGHPATSAELDGPGALCIDKDGNLYVADTANQRIRMIGAAHRGA